jgi:hypothetical protein
MAMKSISTLADIGGEILVTPSAPGGGKSPALFVRPVILPGGRIPARAPVVLTRRQQRRIAGLIDRLIRLLDDADHAPDREPEPIEDDTDREDSAQAPVTPDSARPTAVIWWGAQA